MQVQGPAPDANGQDDERAIIKGKESAEGGQGVVGDGSGGVGGIHGVGGSCFGETLKKITRSKLGKFDMSPRGRPCPLSPCVVLV